MASGSPRVVIIAGEASGDTYGASLAERLCSRASNDVTIEGIGGRRMREAGVSLFRDSSTWSAIGIVESLRVVPRLMIVLARLKSWLRTNPPDLLVLIDFGAFNVRVARYAHSIGVKVLYFVPPGSWRRGATYARLRGLTDRIVTPFPWSEAALRELGFAADFFGHPLLDLVVPDLSRSDFCELCGFDPGQPIVGFLPGSRRQEIEHNLPALMVAAAELIEAQPGLQFAVPLAQTVDPSHITRDLLLFPWLDVRQIGTARASDGLMRVPVAQSIRGMMRDRARPTHRVRVALLSGMTGDVLAHSRAAAMCSGSVTIEAAILRCPAVIIYRGSALTRIEFRLLGRGIRYIGMPNLILDRFACRELLDHQASPDAIASWVRRLIDDSPERAQMLRDFEEVRSLLGSPGAIGRTVETILSMIGVPACTRKE